MVYCGKPSGGCHSCRKKKTRCDQKPEGCTQCLRAKRTCPGYRQVGDVIFRNESENVIRKFNEKEARSKSASKSPASSVAVSPAPSGASSEESLELVQGQQSPVSFFSLATNIEDQATAYFITNYVVHDVGPSRGYLDYLTYVFRHEEADVGLLAGMKAVGLAGVAHMHRAPSFLNNARYQYGRALEATNAALKSPLHFKKDSLLVSIMLLGMFETVTGSRKKSLKDWAEHIKGSAALLKVRGVEQLNTVYGRRMFVQAASSLAIMCVQAAKPLPTFIIEWTRLAKTKLKKPEPSWLALEAMQEFTMFRASVVSGSISEPQDIIAQALQLDGGLASIFDAELPSDWTYETIYTDVKCDYIYNGRYHIYYNPWIAQIWNSMRTVRAMLHEIIRGQLLAGFSAKPPRFTGPLYTAQYQTSTDILYELQADILFTIPQHLGLVSLPYLHELHSDNASMGLLKHRMGNMGMENTALPPMSGPLFLMWPLWFAGIMDIVTEETQHFVIKNLKIIGEVMGIQQAVVLAKTIENQTSGPLW